MPRVVINSSLTILITCWAGFRALDYLYANRTLAYTGDEILDHAIVDVSFQQSQAHFTHGSINISRREFSPAA